MNVSLLSFVALWLTSFIVSPTCGPRFPDSGSRTPIPGPQTDSLVVTDTIVKADSVINWEKMTHDQRKQYMKEVIMPKLKPIFIQFDTKKFGGDERSSMKCVTCHGTGAKNGQFKMPTPDLPKLPATRAEFDKLAKEKPQWMEFMAKTVKPSMANLLSMPQFDPQTGKGFSCGNCHMRKD